jgi:uracil-DNA glycosylase
MHESWLEALGDELEQPYMAELRAFLLAEVTAGRRFYPPADRVFNALALTPFDEVRVVILGQDPYHGAGQAMGLCFSVPAGVRPRRRSRTSMPSSRPTSGSPGPRTAT